MKPPELPDPAAIAATPCSLQLGSSLPRHKPHDLAGLETSGLLDRLGYQVQPATYGSVFRSPDSVRQAFRTSSG